MAQFKIKSIFLGSALFLFASLNFACSNSSITSGEYWNVVMAGNSTATIVFGQPVATQITSGGSTGSFGTSPYNFQISGGATTCQMIIPGMTIVATGAQQGTISFSGTCQNQMTSNLLITLGNSTAGVLDVNGNYIVAPGKSVSASIAAPGAAGANTGNIAY